MKGTTFYFPPLPAILILALRERNFKGAGTFENKLPDPMLPYFFNHLV
jgi:hypothetical protein